ncbi:restriction endonuclease subunit S [Desulfuromonas acetoxidans]|uniref:restriction endonuclease subunit S n=1 Tax=Desulfuromonas acetoxidans TaxID=891 RepID=UPI00292FACA2|nr:restriction endonuclease subunit S [Desulfuromonas acetoxidans]
MTTIPHRMRPSEKIEWLPEIPEDWSACRLKDVIDNLISGVSVNATDIPTGDDGLGVLKTSCVGVRGFRPGENKSVWKEEYARVRCSPQKDNIIISRMNTPELVGASGYVTQDYPNLFLPDRLWLTVFKKRRPTSPKWLSYLFISTSFRFLFSISATGTSPSMKNLGQDVFLSLQIPLPPLPEQKSIAEYLDRETERIDRKVELLEEKARLYKELKKSLINETVTRGLDKSAPLRPSGVDWIGDIPGHWRVERIGTAFDERSEKVSDVDYPPLSVTMQGIVPQLDTAAKTQHNDNRKRVAKGDYVINSRSDRRGSSGVSPLDGSVSVINIVLKPRKNFYGGYLHHLFRSYRFIEEFYRNGRGIVDDLWTTKYSVMKAIEFAFPPTIEEQQTIADYLNEKTAKIDQIVDAIQDQVKLLKELRKTLINDVVTGKIRVSEPEGANL